MMVLSPAVALGIHSIPQAATWGICRSHFRFPLSRHPTAPAAPTSNSVKQIQNSTLRSIFCQLGRHIAICEYGRERHTTGFLRNDSATSAPTCAPTLVIFGIADASKCHSASVTQRRFIAPNIKQMPAALSRLGGFRYLFAHR